MHAFHRCALAAPLVVAMAMLVAAEEQKGISLLSVQDAQTGKLAGWKFVAEDTKPPVADVWKLGDDGVLVCRGTPKGYIATEKAYTDFTLRLEWRWPKDRPGRGGVLFRQTGPDGIWPKSLEAQINHPDAGDFWGLINFRLAGPAERLKVIEHPQFGTLTNLKKTADAEKPTGEWNRYEIRAAGETVTLLINGQEVNRATGCEVAAGPILLTSEGDEIHFRRIELFDAK